MPLKMNTVSRHRQQAAAHTLPVTIGRDMQMVDERVVILTQHSGEADEPSTADGNESKVWRPESCMAPFFFNGLG